VRIGVKNIRKCYQNQSKSIKNQEGGCLMPSIVRTMKPGDIPSVMDLSAIANWNQTPDDWRRILQLSANGCRLIEDDGRIVATVSLLPYGTRLAWIGMLITRPEHRLQGFARRLMEDAIASAERDGIRTLKLDATDEGRPLYESLGFVVEGTVERWSRDAGKFAAAEENPGAVEDSGNGPSHGVRISNALFFWTRKPSARSARLCCGRCPHQTVALPPRRAMRLRVQEERRTMSGPVWQLRKLKPGG
jgi:GNAT superfamily N-acetyltransferase